MQQMKKIFEYKKNTLHLKNTPSVLRCNKNTHKCKTHPSPLMYNTKLHFTM